MFLGLLHISADERDDGEAFAGDAVLVLAWTHDRERPWVGIGPPQGVPDLVRVAQHRLGALAIQPPWCIACGEALGCPDVDGRGEEPGACAA